MVKFTKSPRAPLRRRAENEERKASKSTPNSLLSEPAPASASTPRSPNASSDKVALLQKYHQQALQHAANYQNLISYATSMSATNPAFQQQALTELSEFSTNFKGFTTVLGELGADKGTANLDPTNDLEILLKNIVNANKDILAVTYDLVDSFPIVGPILVK
ncbi:hypothetical protein K503DRAFT_682199 [Rhizopogon vinicolor AM-OR11-026]|uniref:Uncharacterized protein n=1 Tax=Rhizopogon vinicolor AM-OR11-026 TaxID=1314800 RepID=A0A1B7NDN9_9AGAM|nr:hypothetical protein K503DRAFT_682199 [Rhizopogon vinicolor AM-OR11-026]